jgi:hypothetical protein
MVAKSGGRLFAGSRLPLASGFAIAIHAAFAAAAIQIVLIAMEGKWKGFMNPL